MEFWHIGYLFLSISMTDKQTYTHATEVTFGFQMVEIVGFQIVSNFCQHVPRKATFFLC